MEFMFYARKSGSFYSKSWQYCEYSARLAAAEYINLSHLHSFFSVHQHIFPLVLQKQVRTAECLGSCGIGHICLPPTVPLSKNQKSPPNHAMSAEKSCQKAILGLTMDTKVISD